MGPRNREPKAPNKAKRAKQKARERMAAKREARHSKLNAAAEARAARIASEKLNPLQEAEARLAPRYCALPRNFGSGPVYCYEAVSVLQIADDTFLRCKCHGFVQYKETGIIG